ncbi:aminopeptidase N isoform X2 [Acyrthosiphon pisum]|nr:aminopeptidase N isoform X2 [Acyrthosiphon pisum]XP_008186166.1 aminopeptidase N isoform X2 [Acyrthosiphon pisum]XP_016662495.1 aminopeptidase N isoform X2 [Acyrthosiphon pisum]|eukprot:XP_008186165.1 PREDICTED: aminopeptidase N isoform X2 [Acyrthosiphon pisum]
MKFVGFKMIFIIALSLMGSVVNSKETSEFKLPPNFNPTRYELDINTYLEDKFMFEGLATIFVTCIEATNTIVLHSNSLNIDNESVSVIDTFGFLFPVNSTYSDPNKDLMYVSSTEKFKPGDKYVLTIPFSGNITDQLAGYYKSSYVDKESNQTRWLAVTQFEPADARRAFPCFDEPEYKATFKIFLGHKKGLTSISNMKFMKQINCSLKPDYVIDEFEESVPMSTYLVAYMVSDFVYTETNSGYDQVKFRIISRKDAVNQTKFAINVGPKVLKYYEDYFDEKFPLQKQDMAAIPDFSAGAMENWGLVTYRETELLIDPDVATIYNVHGVAEVIAHELAHQWFGNLVTMKWWTDLWLNEGFATYVAARGVDYLYPEWNSFQVETVQNFLRVLDLDSLQSSHPVSVAVGHPDEIAQIFDTISYTKGSYLLHMMNTFLGEDTFKQGIRNYIHKHKFANAEQDDLWSSLTEEAHRQGTLDKNLTVKQIMDTWTLQTGYPVLNVVRNYSAGTVTLSQERYLTNKSNGTNNKSCWWIPITMTTSKDFNQTNAKSWLNCENNNLTTPLAKDNEWVIYNMQIAGLYRVLYDTRNWMSIISTLNDPTKYETIPMLNRVQLIFDSLSFSQVGDLDYEITFQLLKYLKHEKEYAPWLAAFHGLAPINNLLKRTPNHAMFQNYMQRMLSSVYSKFGNMNGQTEGFEKINFKNIVTAEACGHQIKNCTQQALDLFRKWMKTIDPDNNNILPIELKPVIYCQALKCGGVDEWNFLWERYQRSNLGHEKESILYALGCSSRKLLLQRYLNWSLDKSIIRKQDAYTVFYSVAKNDAGFSVAKDFLYRKIADISKYYRPRGDHVGRYVNVIGSQMKTKEELGEIQTFIDISSGHLKGADLVINQTIETIKRNTEWTSKFSNTIVNYMVQ